MVASALAYGVFCSPKSALALDALKNAEHLRLKHLFAINTCKGTESLPQMLACAIHALEFAENLAVLRVLRDISGLRPHRERQLLDIRCRQMSDLILFGSKEMSDPASSNPM